MHPEKVSIVRGLSTQFNSSPFVFVADFQGLKVHQFAEFRNRLYKVGARCSVVKNTWLRLALAEAGLPSVGELRGQTCVIMGAADVAAAAKVVKTFTAEFKKPQVKVGVVDKLVVSEAQVNAIADLPAKEVLLAQLLGVLQAPASKLVRLLNEPAASLARVLQAKVDAANGGSAPDEAAA